MGKGILAVGVLALIILSASEPTWILFATGGVVAGLGVRLVVRSIRRSPRQAFYRGLAAAFILLLTLLSNMMYHSNQWMPGRSFSGRAKYSVYINYARESDSWIVKDDLLVLDTADVQRKFQELHGREAIGHMGELARILSSCGWQQQGTVDSMHM